MTRFIIHVGPHKTGTTYLQEAFAQTRALLAERGIHYPHVWGNAAHHALYDRLRLAQTAQLEADFAGLHAGGHETVLISVEGLASLPEPTIVHLRSLLGADNPVRAVFYVRAWGDILPSHWKETVKGGETMLLPDYLYRRLQNPAVSHFVNFGVGLRIWRRVFGADSVRLVAYNQIVATKTDLFRHFAAQFLDWRDPPALEFAAANVSPGTADIEILRTVAAMERLRLGRALLPAYAQALAAFYMQQKAALVPQPMADALNAHRSSLFINETGLALSALHRELFAEFSAALVPPRLPNFFFRPRRAEIPFIGADWVLEPGVLDTVRAIRSALQSSVEASGRGGTRP